MGFARVGSNPTVVDIFLDARRGRKQGSCGKKIPQFQHPDALVSNPPFRPVIFRLCKAEDFGCPVSRLTLCSSRYQPRPFRLLGRATVDSALRTGKPSTWTNWSMNNFQTDSNGLRHRSIYRNALPLPTLLNSMVCI